MSYVIYNKSTDNKIVTNPRTRISSYKTISAAKAAITRMSKRYQERAGSQSRFTRFEEYQLNKDPQFIYGVAEFEHYRENLERFAEKTNVMTGDKFVESVNTPHYMSPSSETYWSM